MSAEHDEELAPSETPGFKVGAKKTIDEYKTLDQDDDALNRWKESLLGDAAASPADDPRRVVIQSLALEFQEAGREDVLVDLSTPSAQERVRNMSFIIKEGVTYRMKVKFKVQHEVMSGLKYIQVVKRKGITVDKLEEMVGSYPPKAEPYEKQFPWETAPSGMLARGHYDAKSTFIDDDKVTHSKWNWAFDIKKDWK